MRSVRCLFTMSLDLNTILKDWSHESGSIKVRKIAGLDGREKLQLRVDLGVLQMELTGRPDGRRPHNCESLLEYHQKRAARAEQKGETYEVTPEQCAELQQEGIQYYHRYLSLFQINDFQGVVRDTQRNLDLFTFVAQHTDREEFSWALQQFRPYVLMMNTRAKASILLGEGKFAEAISEIERGRDAITEFLQQSNFPELVSKSSEIAFLDEWLEEVKAKRPLSKLEVMQREMETAIAKELYERAAELRDAIKLLKNQKTIVRVAPDKMRAIADMLNKFNSNKAASDKPRLTATGQRETINGYETEQYTYEGPDFKATYWIAPNYPNGAAVLAQLQSIKSELWDAANTKMPDFRDFPGLPIRMRVMVGKENPAGEHSPSGLGHPIEITSTVTGVSLDSVADGQFTVPANYKERKLPDISNQNAAPSVAPNP